MKNIEGSAHEFASQLLLGSGVMVAIGGLLFREQMVQFALEISEQCSTYLNQLLFYIAALLS